MTIKKEYKKVAVGGTFDKFHNGHKKLLEEAFKYGKMIIIGVTSDNFGSKKGNIESCDERINNINHFLTTKYNNFQITRLDDHYGSTIYEDDFDVIVVSKETKSKANEINEIREKKGMKKLNIIVINFVYATDGIPISSTRIRKGEIDTKGHILK